MWKNHFEVADLSNNTNSITTVVQQNAEKHDKIKETSHFICSSDNLISLINKLLHRVGCKYKIFVDRTVCVFVYVAGIFCIVFLMQGEVTKE